MSDDEVQTSMKESTMVEYTKVEALRPRMRGVNVIVKVVSKGETREVTSRRDLAVHRVAEALVGDETGCVLLNLWDDQIPMFDENDVVEIRNGYASLFRGFLRLNIGRYGTAEKVDREMEDVNEENNLSETKHGYYSYRSSPGKPYRRRYRRY